MYSDPSSLDQPPPPSQFRRPWSPEPFDRSWQGTSANPGNPPRQRRQEASDASVDALDLADYAKTLRFRQAEDPYPPFPGQQHQHQPQAHYPPSAFPYYTPQLATSRDSVAMNPPSLISRGPTLSSAASHRTGSSNARQHRRPFSLPTTPHNSSQGSSRGRMGRTSPARGGPYIVDPDMDPSAEIDISHFPKWSRGWYNSNSNPSSSKINYPDDIYTPLPTSHFNTSSYQKKKTPSPFDPGYIHDPYNAYGSDYNPYDPPPPLSSNGHDSRDVLPWSMDPPEYGPPLDPMLKEERMRMLEREFGPNAKGKAKENSRLLLDEDGAPLIGSVDAKGNLVTAGPKRRVLFRVFQLTFAATACIPAIYAAIAIKPKDELDPPPPANKPPAYVLYGFSSVTLLVLLYLFAIRPCCCGRRKKPSDSSHPLGAAANMGMMVLPVGGQKGKKPKKKKGKNKYGQQQQQGDVQVNLIVDPKAFQGPQDESDEEEEEYDSMDDVMPGAFEERRARRKRRNRKRKSVMEGFKLEEEWKIARSWLKKLTMVDVVMLVFWAAVFIFIMTGKRCPSGTYDGWCTAYNVSTASACLLAFAFGVSIFFDVQDLHASKQSPRTRG